MKKLTITNKKKRLSLIQKSKTVETDSKSCFDSIIIIIIK